MITPMTTRTSTYAPDEAVSRPSQCPFCNGRAVDTLAKVITPDTSWRCRLCEKTWTIGSRKPS